MSTGGEILQGRRNFKQFGGETKRLLLVLLQLWSLLLLHHRCTAAQIVIVAEQVVVGLLLGLLLRVDGLFELHQALVDVICDCFVRVDLLLHLAAGRLLLLLEELLLQLHQMLGRLGCLGS